MNPNNTQHNCWACGNPEVTVDISVTYRPGKDEIIVSGWNGKAGSDFANMLLNAWDLYKKQTPRSAR